MIVVDTNILAYLYLPGPQTAAAEALLAAEPGWAAPVLWRSEFRNILAGCARRGAMSWAQVATLQAEAEALMAGSEYEVDSRAVFDLAGRSDCTAYDCEFVALARQLGARLVTQDRQILRAFPESAKALAPG